MTVQTISTADAVSHLPPYAQLAINATLLRALLVAGCCTAVAVAVSQGQPDAYLALDPELARLLRGMALSALSLSLSCQRRQPM